MALQEVPYHCSVLHSIMESQRTFSRQSGSADIKHRNAMSTIDVDMATQQVDGTKSIRADGSQRVKLRYQLRLRLTLGWGIDPL